MLTGSATCVFYQELLVHDWSLWHIRSLKNNNNGINNNRSKVKAARREVHRALRKSNSSAV